MKLAQKQLTALKGLLITQKGVINKNYSNVSVIFDEFFKGGKVYYVTTSNRKYVTQGFYERIADVCDILKISYKDMNDAPRGGRLGDYIKISRKKELTFEGVCNLVLTGEEE